ncbi:MAG TPA: VWA domain-containing protein [Planctomycetes bacterium]|nr:VWA domain-containing protein [Planctomycetota bacterium]
MNQVRWGFPTALFALWLVPLIGFLLVRAHFKRRDAARRFVEQPMVERLLPAFDTTRVWLKAILVMTAVTLLIVAIARPRFGFDLKEISSRGVDLFVLLDVSRSMLAEDVKPNRLERAKSDILDLLQKLEGDRVGLIVFAGAPVVQVPLTTDQGFFKIALEDVDSDSAPRGGTLIGDAIRKALASMETRSDRDQAIVLITDGGDQDSFPAEAAKQAAERNVRIITVGLGDVAEGARIPQRAESGGLTFVQHEGQEVWSKMDESLLEQMATTTQGAYVPAQRLRYDLGQIYDDQLARLTQGDISTEQRKRYREQFQMFAIPAFLLLLLEMWIPGYRRRQTSDREVTA